MGGRAPPMSAGVWTAPPGYEPLSDSEASILRFLPTHLTAQEIAASCPCR